MLDARPVGELAGLSVRQCSALSDETERLWAEVMRLVGENERLRAKVGKLAGSLEEAMITGLDRRRRHDWSRLRAITPVGKHGNGENQDDRPGEHEIQTPCDLQVPVRGPEDGHRSATRNVVQSPDRPEQAKDSDDASHDQRRAPSA